MNIHPWYIEFLASDRISSISHQVKQERLALGVKATGQGRIERFLARLSQPGLRSLMTEASSRSGQLSEAEGGTSGADFFEPRKPQEQCC